MSQLSAQNDSKDEKIETTNGNQPTPSVEGKTQSEPKKQRRKRNYLPPLPGADVDEEDGGGKRPHRSRKPVSLYQPDTIIYRQREELEIFPVGHLKHKRCKHNSDSAGKGQQIAEIPSIVHAIGLIKATDPRLILLHRLFFPKFLAHPTKDVIKKHLRAFSGYPGDDEIPKGIERMEMREAKELAAAAQVLDISASGTKQQLIKRLSAFAAQPVGTASTLKGVTPPVKGKPPGTPSPAVGGPTGLKKGKKPMNAYMLFANATRARVMAANEGKSVADIGKLLGQEWRALPEMEKNKWKTQAEEEKRLYQGSEDGTAAASTTEENKEEGKDNLTGTDEGDGNEMTIEPSNGIENSASSSSSSSSSSAPSTVDTMPLLLTDGLPAMADVLASLQSHISHIIKNAPDVSELTQKKVRELLVTKGFQTELVQVYKNQIKYIVTKEVEAREE